MAAGHGGGAAVAVGLGGIQFLLRAIARLHQLQRAVVVGQGAHLIRLGGGKLALGCQQLRLGLADGGVLRIRLARKAGDSGVLRGDFARCGIDGQLIIAIIDAGEQVSSLDKGIFGGGHGGDIARDFCRQYRDIRLHIGIVRGDEKTPDREPIIELERAKAKRRQHDQRQNQAAALAPGGQHFAIPALRHRRRAGSGDRHHLALARRLRSLGEYFGIGCRWRLRRLAVGHCMLPCAISHRT